MTTIVRATWSLWVQIASTRRRHGVFFVLKRTAGESRVPERPCGFPRETGRVCFPEKQVVLVQRSCQIARADFFPRN